MSLIDSGRCCWCPLEFLPLLDLDRDRIHYKIYFCHFFYQITLCFDTQYYYRIKRNYKVLNFLKSDEESRRKCLPMTPKNTLEICFRITDSIKRICRRTINVNLIDERLIPFHSFLISKYIFCRTLCRENTMYIVHSLYNFYFKKFSQHPQQLCSHPQCKLIK